MLMGGLLLLGPAVVYLATLPFTGRFRPGLRTPYRILGGLIVFAGGATSCYFAFYGGDQGGIAAYIFQRGVIVAYAVLSISFVGMSTVLNRKGGDSANG